MKQSGSDPKPDQRTNQPDYITQDGATGNTHINFDMARGTMSHINQVAMTPEGRGAIEALTVTFDACVDTLRDRRTFPDREINSLVTALWRLVGNKLVPTAVSNEEFGLRFAVVDITPEPGKGQPWQQPAIYLPINWPLDLSNDMEGELSKLVEAAVRAYSFAVLGNPGLLRHLDISTELLRGRRLESPEEIPAMVEYYVGRFRDANKDVAEMSKRDSRKVQSRGRRNNRPNKRLLH